MSKIVEVNRNRPPTDPTRVAFDKGFEDMVQARNTAGAKTGLMADDLCKVEAWGYEAKKGAN